MAPHTIRLLCALLAVVAAGREDAPPPEQLLFIGIFSPPLAGSYAQRRADMRQSWLRHPALSDPSSGVKYRFVLGEAPNATTKAALWTEEDQHHDFVHLPQQDGYNKLSAKTLAFFHWFSESTPTARYVMKIDDDTWPHVDTILALLRGYQGRLERPAYVGKLLWNAPVLREGKWAESRELYGADNYPVYASGSGYILDSTVVRELSRAYEAGETRLLSNEDTTVGVMINATIKSGVYLENMRATIVGCHIGDAFSMNLCPGEMRCMWAKRQAQKQDICCRPSSDYGASYAQSLLQTGSSFLRTRAAVTQGCQQTFEA